MSAILESSERGNVAVGGLGVASLRVLANTSAFEQSLKRSITRIGVATGALLAAAAGEQFLQGAITNSIQLQKQVKTLQTLLSPSEVKNMSTLGLDAAGIRKVSSQIGIGAKDVADSLYLIVSSGVPAADAVDTLVQASKGAIAVGADLVNTVDFTTSAINAYGNIQDVATGKTYDAARANDILFKALQYGKGSLNDFAKYISSAIPAASSLGVSLEDLAASAAASTLTGQSARKVFTGMKVALQGLGDTTKGVGKAFSDITGKTFRQFIKDGGTIGQAAKILGDNVKGGIAGITNLGGAKEGLVQLQQLALQYDKLPAILKGTTNSLGAAAKASDIVNQSISRQLDFLKTRFQNFQGSVGDWFVPIITKALVAFDDFRPRLVSGLQDILVKAQPLISSLAATFAAVGKALTQVNWAGVGSAVGQALIPIGALVIAVDKLVQVGIGPLVKILNILLPILGPLAGAILAYKAATILATKATVLFEGAQALLSRTVGANIAVLGKNGTALGRITSQTGGAAAKTGILGGAIGKAGGFLKGAAGAAALYAPELVAVGVGTYYAYKAGTAFGNYLSNVPSKAAKAADALVKYTVALGLANQGSLGAAKASTIMDFHNQNGTLNDQTGFLQGPVPLNSQGGLLNSTNGGDSFAAAQKKAEAAAQKQIDDINKLMKSIGTGADYSAGSSADSGAKSQAAATAKAAAAAIKKAKAAIPKDLKFLGKDMLKETSDQFKTSFDKLFTDIKAAGKKVPAAVTAGAKSLEKMADSLHKSGGIIDQLADAKTKLQNLKDEADSFAQGIKDSFLGLADVTKTGYNSIEGLTFRMAEVLTQTQKFHDAVIALSKTNLDKNILSDIINAGPEAGLAAAQGILAGGQAGINTLNGMETQISKLADDTAAVAVDKFKAPGIALAQGIVTGLQSQEDKVVAAMVSLANKLVKATNKVFKIKSPSRVFHEIGAQLPAGMVTGIQSGLGDVLATTSDMHGAATEGANGISMSGSGVPAIHVYIGDQELTGMISVQVNAKNRKLKSAATTRSRSGTVIGATS